MPELSEELAFASTRNLGKKLRAKEFSCVALAEFFLNRLKSIGPKLNAVVTLTDDLAMREAALADRELASGKDRGPLHGIPYGVKDLLATKEIPTSWGAAPFRERIIDADATVVARLRDAGAVLVAKLAMVEIAGGISTGKRIVFRAGTQPVGHISLGWRLVVRPRISGGRRACAICNRFGNLGVDRHTRCVLQRQRAASNLRTSQPTRRNGTGMDGR